MTTEIPVRADRSLKQAGAAANVRDEEEGAESSPPVEPAQDWWSPSSPLPPVCIPTSASRCGGGVACESDSWGRGGLPWWRPVEDCIPMI